MVNCFVKFIRSFILQSIFQSSVKRRKALKQIGLSAAAGLLVPSWFSSCKHSDPGPEIKYDGTVAIIGAGISGLYVADMLSSKGIKVVIYEASDRLGGRIRTLRTTIDKASDSLLYDPDFPPYADFPVELGAEQILGSDSAWGNMIGLLKIPTIDFTSPSSNSYLLDGNLKIDTDLVADNDFITARDFLNQLSNFSSESISAEQTIQLQGISTRMYAILNSWIGNKYGTSNDRLGMKGVAESASLRKHDQKKLTLSINPMEDVVGSRFSNIVSKIQFNTVVKSIDYSGDLINITDQNSKTVTVDKVIVTVPVSILKSGDISFSPPLPGEKINALNRMDMDKSIRVVLDFKENIWGDTTAFIYGGIKGPEYFSSGLGRSQFNKTLSVTINGESAETFSLPDVLNELNAVMDVTNNIRQDDGGNPIVVIKDWSKEPFIKGGSSYLKPGGSTLDRVNLAAAVDKKLFFAGEATDNTGEAGTVNGALLSAERVAQEVIDAIVKV